MKFMPQDIHIKWIHTSDVHGCLFSTDYLTGKPVSYGLSSVYSYVSALRRHYPDSTILTDGGDVLQGQPLTYYYNYVDTEAPHLVALCMNAMQYDALLLGNHDVEAGHAVYDRWIAQTEADVLGANVIDTTTNKPYLKPYKIIERQGIRIAVLGMLTSGVPNWLPQHLWQGLRFDDVVQSCSRWVDYIRSAEHPDLLVGLFHTGFEGGLLTPQGNENQTRQVAEQVPGFDLILYGHDHRARVTQVTNRVGQSVLCVGTTSMAIRVAEVDIHLERRDGHVAKKKITAKLPYVRMTNTPDAVLFEAEFTDQRNAVSRWVNRPIGLLQHPLVENEAYFGPCCFIDFIHQFQLAHTGADVSFVAPLSFNSRLEAGTLTMRDLFALYRFENYLCTLRLSGAEIVGFLEFSYSLWVQQMHGPDDHLLLLDYVLDNGQRLGLKNVAFNMESAAGLLYDVDVSQPYGHRIRVRCMADGRPFQQDAYYTVVMNSYRAAGGGELLTRGAGISHPDLPARVLWASQQDVRLLLMRWVEQQGEVAPQCLHHWQFVPLDWAREALERDRKILFGE